jgi:hypothetical protein
MRCIHCRIEANLRDPRMYDPCVLPRRQMGRLGSGATREEKILGLQLCCANPSWQASLAWSVMSNCTGRCVFCCMTIARLVTVAPCETSRTRSSIKWQARSLLSIPRLNNASSLLRLPNCRRTRIAQISFSLKGAFCPNSKRTLRRLNTVAGTEWASPDIPHLNEGGYPLARSIDSN